MTPLERLAYRLGRAGEHGFITLPISDLRAMFAETAILLTHPDESRRAVAKERVFAVLFPEIGGGS